MGMLAVFDLDYTIWPANADTDFMRPLQCVSSESGDKKTRIYDLRNREVKLYPDIEKIFKFLTDKGITIAISSKDTNPGVRFSIEIELFLGSKIFRNVTYKMCERILELHGLLDYIDPNLIRIAPVQSKRVHFADFFKSGFKPSQTAFFDDSRTNIKVAEKLGAYAVLVKGNNKEGVTFEQVENAIAAISKKQ